MKFVLCVVYFRGSEDWLLKYSLNNFTINTCKKVLTVEERMVSLSGCGVWFC
jgi:hypothetical protein